jgi:hypothetical protein
MINFLNNITFYEVALIKGLFYGLVSRLVIGWDTSHQASPPIGFMRIGPQGHKKALRGNAKSGLQGL